MTTTTLSTAYVNRPESIYSGFRKLLEKYPNTNRIFNHNKNGTIDLLKGYDMVVPIQINFQINILHEEKVSLGEYTRDKFVDKINHNIDEYFANIKTKEGGNFREELGRARNSITDHFRSRYYDSVEKVLIPFMNYNLNFELNVSDHYTYGETFVAWSCIGCIKVTESWGITSFKIEFSGEPDIKVLLIDCDKLVKLERLLGDKSEEEQLEIVDKIEKKNNPKAITWDNIMKLT